MGLLGPSIYWRMASGKFRRKNKAGKGKGSARDGCESLTSYTRWPGDICVEIKGNEGTSPMDTLGSALQQKELWVKGLKEGCLVY